MDRVEKEKLWKAFRADLHQDILNYIAAAETEQWTAEEMIEKLKEDFLWDY